MFKSSFFVLLGVTFVLSDPELKRLENASENSDFIVVDDTTDKENQIMVLEPNEYATGGFSTLPPTPEPTVGEEVLPEDVTSAPSPTINPTEGEENLPEDHPESHGGESIGHKVKRWIKGIKDRIKSFIKFPKTIVKNALESVKNIGKKLLSIL